MAIKPLFRDAILSLVCIGMLECMRPITPSDPLNPSPDASVSDVFTGFIADCSDLLVGDRSSKADFWVRSCMELEEGSDACLVKGADAFTKDALVCLLIDMNVQWQRDIASNLASPQDAACSTKANRWLRDHQVGARR